MPNKTLIILFGPTAVGKTKTSVALASQLGCSIINADSRQVFKELSIGTAKPTEQEMAGVKHYFVNDRSIEEGISAGKFEQEALEILKQEFSHNDVCLLSGGSGLYIDALCLGLNEFPPIEHEVRMELMKRLEELGSAKLYEELEEVDPEYAEEIDSSNSQRIIRALEIYHASGKKYSALRVGMNSRRDFDMIFIGLERQRSELYDRINARMDKMITAGLFNEAHELLAYRHHNALQTVGYNEVFMFEDGLIDRTETIRLLKRNSRRYAKRQLTWFKRNKEAVWFHPEDLEGVVNYIKSRLDA